MVKSASWVARQEREQQLIRENQVPPVQPAVRKRKYPPEARAHKHGWCHTAQKLRAKRRRQKHGARGAL